MIWVVLFLAAVLIFGLGTAVHITASLLWLALAVLVVLFIVGRSQYPRR